MEVSLQIMEAWQDCFSACDTLSYLQTIQTSGRSRKLGHEDSYRKPRDIMDIKTSSSGKEAKDVHNIQRYNIPPWKRLKRTKELGAYFFLTKSLSK